MAQRRFLPLFLGALVVTLGASALHPVPPATARAAQAGPAVQPTGTTGTYGPVTTGETPLPCCVDAIAVSDDLRYVTYPAVHSTGDRGLGSSNVFQFDRMTGRTTTITDGDRDSSTRGVSRDGRLVTFVSDASDVVAGQVGGFRELYQWDRATGAVTSVSGGGRPSPVQPNELVGSSTDQTLLIFSSREPNVVPGVAGGVLNLYQWDHATATTSVVAAGNADSFASLEVVGGRSTGVVVSANERYITFGSHATDLVEPPSVPGGNIYQLDRQTGETARVTDPTGRGSLLAASDDGRFVTYSSHEGVARRLSRWDRETGSTSVVAAGSGELFVQHVSPSGGAVIFSSGAPDLVGAEVGRWHDYLWPQDAAAVELLSPGATFVVEDWSDDVETLLLRGPAGLLYLRDRRTGLLTFVTDPGPGTTYQERATQISPDGTVVTWASDSTDELPEITRPVRTIYQWDRATGSTLAVAAPPHRIDLGWVSDDGGAILFSSATPLPGGAGPAAPPYWYLWDRALVPLLPVAPEIVSAEGGSGAVEVRWTPPISNGSAPVTGYRVTVQDPDGVTRSEDVEPGARSAVVDGLVDGQVYRARVTASNAAGAGPPSALSEPTRAGARPGAPELNGPQPQNGAVQLWWTAPAPGFLPITRYRITTYRNLVIERSVEVDAPARTVTIPGLANGVRYQFSVEAISDLGVGPRSDQESAIPMPRGPVYVAVEEDCRLFDSRRSTTGPLRASETRTVSVIEAGSCRVHPDAVAARVTVTAVSAKGTGFLRIGPAGTDLRSTFLNFGARWGASSSGSVQVGGGLDVRAYGSSTDVVVDLHGYWIDYSRVSMAVVKSVLVPLEPCRLFDSRRSPAGTLRPGEERRIASWAEGCEYPYDASGYQATISAVNPTASGYLEAWPSPRRTGPGTVLNHAPGRSTSNTTGIRINGADEDSFSLRNAGAGETDVVIDLLGVYSSGPSASGGPGMVFRSVRPCRVLDTRSAGGALGPGGSRFVPVAGAGGCGVPEGAVAAELTLTAVSPAGRGYLQVGSADRSRPLTTFLNFAGPQSTSNTGALTISEDRGTTAGLRLRNVGASSHYVVEVLGYYTPA